jgi:filamentous hemagglutinin family protein
MSYHTLFTKNSLNAGIKSWLKRGTHLGLGIGAFTPVLALANPTGGQVMAGQASITSPSANGMVIHQSSQSAIINWQQFNIGAGQYVRFMQPSTSSVVLNRVIGGSPTSIFGSLSANGQVFLVNTNGVFFGKGATLDAQGFLASSLDITDSDFLAHNYQFNKAGSSNTDAQCPTGTPCVVNDGTITAHRGGYVVLAGDYSENDGVISAQSGHVILASGAKSTLTLNGNSLVSYVVNSATLSSLAGVDNAGRLDADGGTVIMTADVANALKATVVNNTGLIEARSISQGHGGIYLTAQGGNLVNAGTLDADGMAAGNAGGNVVLKGSALTNLTNSSKISALGQGADGGHVELSGNVLNVRGVANIGKRGSLLLDPGQVSIGGSSSNTGAHSPGGTSGIGHIGVKFIQNTLNAGVDVTIAATQTIEHSSKATKINATTTAAQGGGGNLILNVDHGGRIELQGLNIDIAGDLDASVSPGGTHSHNAAMSFGRITANSIDIKAGTADVTLAPAVTVSGVLRPSLKATGGNIDITAGIVSSYGGSSLNVVAKGDISFHGVVNNAGNVNMTASGEGILASKIISGKNIALKAAQFVTSDSSFDISAAGNLSIKGAIGLSSYALVGDITLTAGKTITLDHGIFNKSPSPLERKNINITGKSLVYTGAGKFSISAQYGSINLDASIGSAGNHAAYSVKLLDHGYGITLERSIYTNGGIVAMQSGSHFGSSPGFGVKVGNNDGKAITLSAQGAVTIVGNAVRIGDAGRISISADDGKSSTHNDVLTLTATHAGSSWGVFVGGDSVAANIGSNSASIDHSVTLHAGQDVDIGASHVTLEGGAAFAVAHGSAKSATVDTSVTVSAGDDIKLTGVYVALDGGYGVAVASSDSKATVSAKVNTSVTLSAGHDVTVSGSHASFIGGAGNVFTVTDAAKQKATASVTSGVDVSAGNDITVTATHTVDVLGGDSAAYDGYAHASNSSAHAASVIDTDVTLDAGHAIALAGTAVQLRGGNDAAGGFGSKHNFGSGYYVSYDLAGVRAEAKSATASLTASADVDLKAGAGGITIGVGGGDVSISGGYGAARGLVVSAGSLSGAKATGKASAHVSLYTSGNMKLKGTQIAVRAADRAAGSALSFTYIYSTSTRSIDAHRALAAAGAGAAALSADGSVTLHAGGTLNMAASTGRLSIHGGSVAGYSASATAVYGGNAGIKTDASVSISVAGNATLKAAATMGIYGSDELVEEASAHADDGGAATISGKDGVAIAVGGAFLASAGDKLSISGADDNAYYTKAVADHGATASVSGDGSINIKAGSIALTAGQDLSIYGGESSVGAHASASASNRATAMIAGKSGVSLIASGAFTATAGSSLKIYGGDKDTGYKAKQSAHNHATATLTTDTSVTISADTVALSADRDLEIHGQSTGVLKYDVGYGSNYGVAKANADGSLNITAVKSFSATLIGSGASHDLEIHGGSDVAYGDQAIAHQHGTATLVGDAAASIVVTGAGGTVTLSTGNQTHAELSIGGFDDNAYSAYAYADHGGSAAITALGGVTISAPGNISIKAKGANTNLSIYGGYEYNGYGASANASGNAAKANITADSSIHLSGNNVTLSAGTDIEIYGGYYYNGSSANAGAKNGGTATVTADASVNISAAGNFTAKGSELSIYGGYEDNADGASVLGYGGVATLNANTSVNITAGGAAKLTAAAKKLYIYGQESYQAYDAGAFASNGGAARLNANGTVNITAGTTFTASAASDLSIYGGNDSNARDAYASADGVGATATIKSGNSVNLNAGGNILIKSGKYAEIYGGYYYNAYDAKANADNGGVASLTEDGSIHITTKGNFTLQASGFAIYGGYEYNADDASASADHSAKATLSENSSVNIKAAGAVSLTGTVGGAEIYGGYEYNGNSADATADNGGTANLSANGSVHITAGTTFTASAQGDLSIYGGYEYNGYEASAQASHGGKANLNADTSVNISAGGALTLKANNSGNLSIDGGDEENAGYAEAYASDGATANLTAKTNVSITAGGAFTGVGDAAVKIWGQSYYNGYEATIDGYNGGKAAMTADGSVSIKGSSLALTANTGALSIYGGIEYDGYGNQVSASNAGAAASLIENSSVTLTATSGNVNIKAGGALDIRGQEYYAGYDNDVYGKRGATANLTADGGVNISGAAVSVTAAGSHLYVFGGSEAGAYNSVKASDGGAATLTGDASVNITASSGFTATLKGSHSHAYLDIYGGVYAGYDNKVYADSGAKATLNGNAGVSIDAGTGAINVKLTGTHAGSNYIEVYGGDYAAYDLFASASDGGVAVLDGNAAVDLLAGNVLISDKTGYVGIFGDGDAADDADAEAAGTGAKVTVTGIGGVNIKVSGAVTVQAGTGASIYGGGDVAADADATADSGGVASVSGVESVTITAGGAFTASAGSDLNIFGGSKAGYDTEVETYTGGVGKASGLANVSIKAGGAVAIKAGTAASDTLDIHGGVDAGAGTAASFIASNANATFVANSGVSVGAGGAMTLTAGGPIEINAGDKAGSYASVKGDHGNVKATVNSGISLSAGGTLTLTLNAGNLSIGGGSLGGKHAVVTASGSSGIAKLGLNQTVSLTAAGAFTVTGADDINIVAGIFAATGTDAAVNTAGGGTATASVSSGITIKGSSLSMHHTGTLTKTARTGLTGALTENGALTITSGNINSFISLAPLGMEVQMMPMGENTLEVTPSAGQSGFAVPQSLNKGVDLSPSPQLFPVSLTGGTTVQILPSSGGGVVISGVVGIGLGSGLVVSPGKAAALPTLAAGGIVVNLEQILSVPALDVSEDEAGIRPAATVLKK